MPGTADTEAEEFNKIYKLEVVVIPPNRTLRRIENPDLVYRTEKEKWDAIVAEILEEQQKGRPVLVGTVSIEKSEKLSTLLDRRGLKRGTTTGGGVDKHVVLNAKYHAQEAEFVAQAGRKGSVTIATNMAGRGTDILLGGNAEFMARQQCLAEEIAERLPKGEERFVEDEQYAYFFHLDAFYRVPRDAYARIFEHFKRQCDAEHDEVVALEGLHIVATERHEARRRQILEGKIRLQDEEGQEAVLDTHEYLMDLAETILDTIVETYAPRQADFEQWNLDGLKVEVARIFAIDAERLDFSERTSDEIRDALWEKVSKTYEEKEKLVGRDVLQRVERDIMLQIVDQQWKDHLYSLDHLKEGIGLRGYGQRDPLVEYKKESFGLFEAMKERIDEEIVRDLWLLRPILNDEAAPVARRPAPRRAPLILNDPAAESVLIGARAHAPAASPFGPSRAQQQ